jgi:hypothetical protein
MASMNAKLDSDGSSTKDTEAAIVRMREQIAKMNETRNKNWDRIIRIQEAAGHQPSLSPTESNTPPVFDTARLQESAATGKKAAADEITAKAELTATVNALELDGAKAEKEAQGKAQEALDLERSTKEAKRVESDRLKQATKCLEHLDNLEEETKAFESTLAELRAHRAKEIDRVNIESWQVDKQIQVLQTGHADTKEKLASVDSSIETTKAEYEKAKETEDAKLHAVQAQVEAAKETSEAAKDMATRAIEDSFGEDCDGIENACKILNEDSVAEYAQILEGKSLHDHCDDSTRENSTHTLAISPR